MGRPKSTDPKTKHIAVWVTESEYEIIQTKARFASFSVSSYLRNLGMNYRIKSMVDAMVVDSLVRSKSDLGRVGGLFKMWLVANDNGKANLGSKSYKEIECIVDELERKQEELIEMARVLMRQGNEKITRKF